MSNAGALHTFSSNKPLPPIVEAANSDCESTERSDSWLQQHGDCKHTQRERTGPEEWESYTSDSSRKSDEGYGVPRSNGLSSRPIGADESSKNQTQSQTSNSSEHGSATRSSRRGSGTFSTTESNTDATSVLQQPLKEGQLQNEGHDVLPRDEFDLAPPIRDGNQLHASETFSDLLFASEHLKNIFTDPSSLLDFTSFLSAYRPKSIPILMYYLDATEALKAVNYAIAIAESLEPIKEHAFTSVPIQTTMNSELEKQTQKAFDVLLRDDLPPFVMQMYVQSVKLIMNNRIMVPAASPMREVLEGMLEVFCLTDPSRPDNPIVFASEAFHRMTQYGMGYIIGRNCRFLQGPKSDRGALERIRKAVAEGRDHCDLILNYRRDGSPFLNLLMLAPLRDINGKIRYMLGAQVDVSNLVPESTEMDDFSSSNDLQVGFVSANAARETTSHKEAFRGLGEILDLQYGRQTQESRPRTNHGEHDDDVRSINNEFRRPGVFLRQRSESVPRNDPLSWINGKPRGFYENYLLLRPYPSLRVLFASPSLRIPGMLQSPIMDKIGAGSPAREDLIQALAYGRSVTAKIRWITKQGDRGRKRWIAFTPLLGTDKQVGVWMAVLVDDESENERRSRPAPPMKSRIATATRAVSPNRLPSLPERPSVVPGPDTFYDISWQEKVVVPEQRLTSSKGSPGSAGVQPAIGALVPELDASYETLEERLRKKRERDAARLLGEAGTPARPTYKSLSPYAFMNNDGP